MNREEAKIWLSIPKQKLEIIAPHIYNNLDVVSAYADGAEVEFMDKHVPCRWYFDPSPSFSSLFEYRVKNTEKRPDEPWKPELGKLYYFLDDTGQVSKVKNRGGQADSDRFEFGNFYRTFIEAAVAVNTIREAFFNSKPIS